ncbi:MAG: heat-shock protein [Crocinitomicaceae bacterium]|nr:heat-shock protein [Crocinitomicaceae bacterium]
MNALVKRNGNYLPEFPSLFDDFFTRDIFNLSNLNHSNNSTLPSVNVKEEVDSFELEVAAPGMSKNDFKIEFDNGRLLISAEKENQKEEKDAESNYTRREFSYKSFQRSFTLSERMIECNKISAKYQDGILHITVPKTEEAKVKPSRLIEIK